LYVRRREFLTSAGVAVVALATGAFGEHAVSAAGAKLSVVKRTITTGLGQSLMFNGYADEVASLYANMNLQKYF
jgi:hypothetical protein